MDTRERLERLRDELTSRLDDASDRDLAPLSRQLVQVLEALEALPSQPKESPLDELTRKRSTRRSQATG